MKNRSEKMLVLCAKLGLALLAGVFAASANASTCSYMPNNSYGNAAADLVSPLNISSLTVGRDVPNGTELYRQTIRPMDILITCTNEGSISTIQRKRWLTATPLPLSSWNGSPYPGRVYQTDVPGIGVALWVAGNPFPYTDSTINCGSIGVACNISYTATQRFDISIIKIGPVSPGVIQAANLPRMQFDIVTGNTLPILRTRFSGSIRVVSQTCTTPNVTVQLGDYKVSDFRGPGTGTPYKNFFIELQNCPAFYGASASLIHTHSAAGWEESARTVNPNVLRFSLTPVNGVVASQRGTVQLSPGTSGAPAATGIGVQLIRAIGGFLQFDTLLPSGLTPSASSGASYSIPMNARYVQTGTDTPTPGPANASVMFTINYQ